MQKSLRSLALVATLTLAAVPALRADQTGCNPHPAPGSGPSSTTISTITTVVLSMLLS